MCAQRRSAPSGGGRAAVVPVVDAPGVVPVDDVPVDEVPVDVLPEVPVPAVEVPVPAVVVPVAAALAVVSVVVVVLEELPHAARPSEAATSVAVSAISDVKVAGLRRGLW